MRKRISLFAFLFPWFLAGVNGNLCHHVPPSQVDEPNSRNTIAILSELGLHRLAFDRALLEIRDGAANPKNSDPNLNRWPEHCLVAWENYLLFLERLEPADRELLGSSVITLSGSDKLPARQVVLAIQSAFLLSEDQFRGNWKAADAGALSQTTADFLDLFERITSLREKLIRQRSDELLLTNPSPLQLSQSNQRDIQFSRLTFLAGWCGYYVGLTRPDRRSELLSLAEVSFREFLQIDTGRALREMPSDWLDQFSDWQARALLGLALIARAREADDDADWCFEMLREAKAENSLGDLAVWEFVSLAWAGRSELANQLALRSLNDPLIRRETNLALSLACLEIANSDQGRQRNFGTSFNRTGLIGLIRLREFSMLQVWCPRVQIDWSEDSFTNQFAFAVFSRFSQDDPNAPEVLRDFQETTSKLASQPILESARLDLANCLLMLAECELALGHDVSAGRHASEAEKSFVGQYREFAATAAWVALRTKLNAADSDSGKAPEARLALDAFQFRYPQSRFQDLIALEQTKLECLQLDPVEAIARWQVIVGKPGLSAEAKMQQVALLHTLSVNERDSEIRRKWVAQFDDLSAQVQREKLTPTQRLRICLQQLYVHQRDEPVSPTLKAKLLRDMRALRPQVPSHSMVYSQSIYYELAIGADELSEPETERLARQLAVETTTPQLSDYGWSVLCRLLKTRIAAGDLGFRTELKMSYQSWLQMVPRLPEDIRKSRFEQVARELSLICLELGDLDTADRQLAELLPSEPADAELLDLVATTKMRLGKFEDALPHWRALIAGTKPGDSNWRKAKLELARCLAQSNPYEALKVLDQTEQLDSEMPAEWHKQIEELRHSLQQTGKTTMTSGKEQ